MENQQNNPDDIASFPPPSEDISKNNSEEQVTPATNTQGKGYSAIASLIITLIPLALGIFCYLLSFTQGRGQAGAIMITYYMTAGIPLSLASLITGIVGLQTEQSKIAKLSLAIKIPTIIFVILYYTVALYSYAHH